MELHRFEQQAVWYTPDIEDNREKSWEDQFRVLIEPMTRAEVQKAEAPLARTKLKTGKRGSVSVVSQKERREVEEDAVRRKVREVANLQDTVHRDDGTVSVEPVVDAKGLIEVTRGAWASMLTDIYVAITDGSHLAEGVRGNFVSGSDYSSPRTHRSGNGDAASVGAPSTESKTTYGTPEAASETTQTSTSTLPLS